MKAKKNRTVDKLIFKEEQNFSNFWFWVFIIVVFTAFLTPTVVALYSELVLDIPYGENPKSTESLLIISGILLLVYTIAIVMFKLMKLVISIRKEGVYYRYPPFILKERYFLKSEIERFEIRKYNPVREYSGAKPGKAFIVKGKVGLQLYLRDGKKVLFGTQRPEAMRKAMRKLMAGSKI